MVQKLCTFVVLALCALANRAEAQECVAQSVVNMTLDAHHTLSWAVREDERCHISSFLVYIFERDHPAEYSFELHEPHLDVSFLEVCHEWTFVVVPVSEETRGHEHHLFSSMPLPADADISIDDFNFTHNHLTGDLHLSWDLRDMKYGNCMLRYRLTIEEEGSPTIDDLYLSERSVNLHFLSPCASYQFGLRAINIAHPTIEGPLKAEFYDIPPARQIAPHLEVVEAGDTSFRMIWKLQNAVRNRCEVTEFDIFGGRFFNYTIPIEDSPERMPIEVEVHSLEPGSMYYLRAAVQNSGGWSDATVVAVQTLDFPPDKEIQEVL